MEDSLLGIIRRNVSFVIAKELLQNLYDFTGVLIFMEFITYHVILWDWFGGAIMPMFGTEEWVKESIHNKIILDIDQ